MSRTRIGPRSAFVFALVASFGIAGGALAQNWPPQRVTFIVPYAAGGPTDAVARVLAPMMEKAWKQPFIVENRPGAGSMVGTAVVAKAAPDGLTLLMNGNGVISAKFFTKEMPYDPADLRPVVELGNGRYAIVTNPQTGIRTMQDFVAYAKKNPKALHYGPILFSNQALDMYALQRRLGIELTEVGYNSTADSTTALLRNDLQIAMGVPSTWIANIKAGKLVGIAVAGPKRNEQLPDVPTAREGGFDLNYGFDFGVWVPARTPQALVTKIGSDIAAAVKTPEYVARLRDINYETLADPLSWPAVVDGVIRNYTEVVQQIGLKPR